MRVVKEEKLIKSVGNEVEVCYKDKGIGSIWHKAIIEATKTTPCSKPRYKDRQFCLRLLKDDFATPFSYLQDDVLVRPVPPLHVEARVEIKEGCVVDVLSKDEWWTGLVVKVVEEDKFLVFFDSLLLPDVGQFERKGLRPHLDWIHQKNWVVKGPQFQILKRLNEESMFSPGTMVEVSSKIDEMDTVWAPAMVIKEEGDDDDKKKCIVKFGEKPLSCKGNNKTVVTVDLGSVRPIPPPVSVEGYKLMDCVEAFRGLKWCKGTVTRIISEEQYMVSFKGTRKIFKFSLSDLRSPMEWEDGVWKTNKEGGSMINDITPSLDEVGSHLNRTETETQGKTFPQKTLKPMRNQKGLGSKRKSGESIPSDAKRSKSAALETRHGQRKELSLTSLYLEKESGTSATPTTQIEDKTQEKASHEKTLQPMQNQDGLGNESTKEKMPEEHNYKDGNRKKRRGDVEHSSDLNENANESLTISPVITATPLKQREAETQENTLLKMTIQALRNRKSLSNKSSREKPKESLLTQASGDKMNGFVMNSNTPTLSPAKEPVTPCPRISATRLEQTEAETHGITSPKEALVPLKNQSGSTNDSRRKNDDSEANNRKRKREQNLGSSSNVAETVANNTTLILPFEKKLPIWKTVESMEVFKIVPQTPHFSPLTEAKENTRELSAVGMMYTFQGLLEEVKSLQLFTPKSTLDSLNDSFDELANHGFDVKAPQSRINELLSLKDRQAEKMEELTDAEKEIADKESEMVEIEQKILEMQRLKEEAKKEMTEMKSRAVTIGQEIEDVELQFQTTVSAPCLDFFHYEEKKSVATTLGVGSEVEVSSNEEGLEGAWFKAILKDQPGKSGRKQLKVLYIDLEAEDGKVLLEFIDQKFIRPVPPESLFNNGEFEEGCVVEAKQRDGWWTCVFVKKLEEDKCLVLCDCPPDLIQFKRKQLRQHFDWINQEWIRPHNKKLSKRCGTMVEVMEELDDGVVCWIPSLIVKEEGGENLIVKSCKYLGWNDEAKTVSSSKIRLVPPPMSVENYELMERVEVFIDPGWREGILKDIVSENKYTVSLEASNELLVFKHSDLRPSKESVAKRFKRKSTKVNAADSPQRSRSSVENGEAAIDEDETEASSAEALGNEMADDDVRNECGTSHITATPWKQRETETQEKTFLRKTVQPLRKGSMNEKSLLNNSTREKPKESPLTQSPGGSVANGNTPSARKGFGPPETPSPRVTAQPLKQAEAEIQRKTCKRTLMQMKNQNGNDAARENESSKDKNRKRKRVETASPAASVEETRANDSTMVLPFEKTMLSLWKEVESMTVPQTPHFSPLMEIEEDTRETSAIGMMFTYSSVIEEAKCMHLSSPISALKGLRNSFATLEKNGFDVKEPHSRIHELLSLKVRLAKKEIEQKVVELQKKREEENKELEQKILEMKKKREEADKVTAEEIRKLEKEKEEAEKEL